MCHETPDTIVPRIIALLSGETVPWTGNEILGRIASGEFPCETHFDESIRLLVRQGKLTSESDPFDPRLTSTTRCRLAYLLSPEARTSAIRLPPSTPDTRKPAAGVAPPPVAPSPSAPVAPPLPSPAARLEAIGKLREEKVRLERLWGERFGSECLRQGSAEFLKTLFLRARVHGLVPRLRDALEKSLGRPVDDFERSCETLIQIQDRDGTIPVGMIESGVKLDLLSYATMDLDRSERDVREGRAGNPANAREILAFLKNSLEDASLNRFRQGVALSPRPAVPAAPTADPLIGSTFGAYKVIAPIGKGGMGAVYEGLDETLDRRVALKLLHPQYADNREYQERFLREARNAANSTLDHPNITQIYAAGRQGPYLWLAMQLVRGRTLTKLLEERTKLPASETLKIARQIAEGLSAAHAARMIHRDIKPDNLMIDETGRVKIMDFGLMRSVDVKKDGLTVDGLFVGTLEYASPEQCSDRPLDARTDLYSLGVVLYELLSGKRPYQARSPMAYLTMIPDPQQPPVPLRQQNPEVPAAIEALVHHLLSKRPEDRPASAAALVAEIDQIPLALSRSAPAPSLPSPMKASPSPMRAAILSIAAWSVVLAAGLAAAFWLWPKEGKLPLVPWSTPQHPGATLGESPVPIPKDGERERTPDRPADAGERGTAELSAFDKALPEGQRFELVGPADWGTWEIDRRDAPGGSVVLQRSPIGIGMATPSSKEQVRLLRRLRGAEKGYRIQWTFENGSSEATAFMVALSVTRWVEVGPRAISLFRVDREGGEEKIVMPSRSALPEPLSRATLHVFPSGGVLLIYLNARLMLALPAADYPLSAGLQLGVSGGSLTLESIRLRDRSGD